MFAKKRGRPTTLDSVEAMRQKLAEAEARLEAQQASDTETGRILGEGLKTLRETIPSTVRIGLGSATPATSIACKAARALADFERFTAELAFGTAAKDALDSAVSDFQSKGNEIISRLSSGDISDEEAESEASELVEVSKEFEDESLNRIISARENWKANRADGRALLERVQAAAQEIAPEGVKVEIPEKLVNSSEPVKIGTGKD